MLPEAARIDPQSANECLRDVVALSTLPAIWFGACPLRIAESLAASLFTTIDPQFVYVAFTDPSGGPTVSSTQTDRHDATTVLPAEAVSAMEDWSRCHDPDELLSLASPLRAGTVRVTTRPLGHGAELGTVAVGFDGDSGPTSAHHLILNVAATQAATAIQNAHLLRSLRESEERFRALVTASVQIVWTADASGGLHDTASWRAFTGQTFEQCRGSGWLDAVHRDDREAVRQLWWTCVAEMREYDTEYRLCRRDGTWRWMAARAVPIVEPGGMVREWVGMNTDITERKEAAETQELLIRELNHRVKNTLATVQALAQQTLRKSRDRAHFVTAFSGRLQALSRVHTLLTRAIWRGADLGELVRDQVFLGHIDESRITAEGPPVALEPQMTLHLALVLHELSTNCCKYGALSAATGQVAVRWSVEDDKLHLAWIERDGPQVSAPDKAGFGTRLIEQSLKAHNGTARVRYEDRGLSWTITLPLAGATTARTGRATRHASAPPPGQEAPAEDRDPAGLLVGKTILVVEDEPLVALDLISCLEELGVRPVGPACTTAEALRMIDSVAIDAALLDANLDGEPVDAVADALARRKVPFAFVSGYGRDSLPGPFRHVPLMAKPFSQEGLMRTAAELLGRSADQPASVQ